jgi:aryl-alcohol dehydrogenase-like predicted oxidoreductase
MANRPSLSKICFGCEPLGGVDWGEVNISDVAEAIDRALELGVNFFDTADVYGLGLSESRLSKILGSRRHDVVIATKGGMSWDLTRSSDRASIVRNSSPEYLRRAVEGSLLRLQLDYLPIYFIHWPDPKTDIRSTFECLANLKDAGKIGWIGCSNFSAEQVRLACQVAEVSYMQVPHNILGTEIDAEIKQIALEKDISIVAYNVLSNGLLSGKYGLDAHFPDGDRRSRLPLFQGETLSRALEHVAQISDAAEASGLTCAQYSIAKVISRAEVVSAILGIKNRQQIEENMAILTKLQS